MYIVQIDDSVFSASCGDQRLYLSLFMYLLRTGYENKAAIKSANISS